MKDKKKDKEERKRNVFNMKKKEGRDRNFVIMKRKESFDDRRKEIGKTESKRSVLNSKRQKNLNASRKSNKVSDFIKVSGRIKCLSR